ncbi:MAG: hypothetical protein Q8P27_01810 [Candidatus Peregrinibacteria bacterium]|nr:hypothetical protein [Candidatus Peregrinibacteria bacterium]
MEKAEANLHAAKQLLSDLGVGESHESHTHAPSYTEMASGLHTETEGDQQIVEGIFDGQNMIGPNEQAYPVPANYASKSKLIPGDKLKLTIMPNGAFLYKQIGPIERKYIKGVLTYEDGQYEVLAEGKHYHVLLASVTYFKASIGDEVTLTVPMEIESDWGAIENIIPQS